MEEVNSLPSELRSGSGCSRSRRWASTVPPSSATFPKHLTVWLSLRTRTAPVSSGTMRSSEPSCRLVAMSLPRKVGPHKWSCGPFPPERRSACWITTAPLERWPSRRMARCWRWVCWVRVVPAIAATFPYGRYQIAGSFADCEDTGTKSIAFSLVLMNAGWSARVSTARSECGASGAVSFTGRGRSVIRTTLTWSSWRGWTSTR